MEDIKYASDLTYILTSEQGFVVKKNSFLDYSPDYSLVRNNEDGSKTSIRYLGHTNDDFQMDSNQNILIETNREFKVEESYQDYIKELNDNGYSVVTTSTYDGVYPSVSKGEVVAKKVFADGTVEKIKFEYKNGNISSKISSYKTRELAINDYYSEVVHSSPVIDSVDLVNGDVLTSSQLNTIGGSEVKLNTDNILAKIKAIRNTLGYDSTTEIMKDIKEKLNLKGDKYKPSDMFGNCSDYVYFSTDDYLDKILDKIEDVVKSIIEVDRNENFSSAVNSGTSFDSSGQNITSVVFSPIVFSSTSNSNQDKSTLNSHQYQINDDLNTDVLDSESDNSISTSDTMIEEGNTDFNNGNSSTVIVSNGNNYSSVSQIEETERDNITIQSGSELYSGIPIYNEDGEEISILENGNYNIYEYKYDEEGNIIAIRISPDGEEEKWIKIDDNVLQNGSLITLSQIGIYHYDGSGLMIVDGSGKQVSWLKSGDYAVYEVKYDINGNIIAVRISPDGEEEKWINIYQDGKYLGEYYEFKQRGLFIYGDSQLIISDINGNDIGVLENGKYAIYGFKFDENGNIIAVRISPDGEEEKWLFLEKNNINIELVSPNIIIDKEIIIDEKGSKINFFNKKTAAGILGVLLITAGVTLYIKYKKSKKVLQADSNEYNIYDTLEDEDNNITDIRVSPDSDDEAWINLR